MHQDDDVLPGLTRRDLLGQTALAAVGLLVGACGAHAGSEKDGGEGGSPGGSEMGARGPSPDAPAMPDELGDEPLGPEEPKPEEPEPKDPGTDEPDPDALSESTGFPEGVASGDITSTSAIFWTQYVGTGALRLVLWDGKSGANAGALRSVKVSPQDGGFVHVDVDGLTAGREYRYAFYETTVKGIPARSPIGRFRTAPEPGTLETIVFGATCCTFNGNDLSALERAGERDDLDAFLHLGDTTYNDYVYTTEDYRVRWAESLTTLAYRSLRQSTALISTWDDHEVFNNWDPETIDPAHLAVATQAFFDHTPIRRDPQNPDRIWRKFSFGDTVEVFVLDCRGERLPSTRRTASAQYLSRAQMDWLKRGLVESTARFKLIVNSVPITSYRFLLSYEADDRWEGYPAAREEILAHIDGSGIEGVVWVAGDFHLGSIGRVSTSGPGSSALEILAGPGGQVGNNLANFLVGAQFDFATKNNNYTTLAFDPRAGEVTVTFYDGFGDVMTRNVYAL